MLLHAKHSAIFTLLFCMTVFPHALAIPRSDSEQAREASNTVLHQPRHLQLQRRATLPVDTFFSYRYKHAPKPLFAIKTNLLYNAVSAVNLELEVPIGRHWSVAGELISPWWLLNEKQHCLQLVNGTLEGRYWFSEHINQPTLTGWFAGLHAGGGYYDLEWDAKGNRGEHLMAGLSGGYAHMIGKSGRFRTEYEFGAGYFITRYQSYTAIQGFDSKWHLVRQHNGTLSWFGPTRVKVSISYMLNYSAYKKKK